ncbi:MAG: hypothetical protein ABIR06_17120 [Cyclobacteriaceae bacterium]
MLNILKVGVFVFGFAACSTNIRAQTGTHDGFELVREADNIVVYERWITFPKSDPPVTAREVKSEFFVKGDIQNALALIRDERQIKNWQKHVSEFKVYPGTDSVWHEYSYHDIPWPVSDQDHFLEYRIENPLQSDGMFITFESVRNDSLAKNRKGVSRMTLSGSWYLQQHSDNKIKITYRILSMPSSIPRFFTDPVIRNNLMSTVEAYIKILENGYK